MKARFFFSLLLKYDDDDDDDDDDVRFNECSWFEAKLDNLKIERNFT